MALHRLHRILAIFIHCRTRAKDVKKSEWRRHSILIAPRSHALLLDGGNLVRRPASVEAVGHAHRQTDGRDWLPGEVLGIKDDDIAEVAFRVVYIGQNPAFVLGGGSWLPHKDRFRC